MSDLTRTAVLRVSLPIEMYRALTVEDKEVIQRSMSILAKDIVDKKSQYDSVSLKLITA